MQDPRHDQTPHSRTGARRQGNISSFQSREKNVLDFSSYRTGDNAQNPNHASMSVMAIFHQLAFAAFCCLTEPTLNSWVALGCSVRRVNLQDLWDIGSGALFYGHSMSSA